MQIERQKVASASGQRDRSRLNNKLININKARGLFVVFVFAASVRALHLRFSYPPDSCVSAYLADTKCHHCQLQLSQVGHLSRPFYAKHMCGMECIRPDTNCTCNRV